MDTSKLKAFAISARNTLIRQVEDQAALLGISRQHTEPAIMQGDVAMVMGKPYPRNVGEQHQKLVDRIRQQSFDYVIEAVAYGWFNRFVALRFMELHGYLEHGLRVLSHPDPSEQHPQILKDAEHAHFPGLDIDDVISLKLAGDQDDTLYRKLLLAQCNDLHAAMPFLFERIDNENELLLPANLLHSDSVIRRLIDEIPEEDWQQVEVIGWLYQFYIAEKKAEVIGKVVKSEDIPAATQLFTPNWIVKYMAQNSLGREWMMANPQSLLKDKMEYYIDSVAEENLTDERLEPESISVLDPACGSGHILVEAYDLLKAMYQERGHRTRDIPQMILKNNLFGLEIDERAAQLSAFALMMKARADDRRIFGRGIQPHIYTIRDTKGFDCPSLAREMLRVASRPLLADDDLFPDTLKQPVLTMANTRISADDMILLLKLFDDGQTFGSMIRIPDHLKSKLGEIHRLTLSALQSGDLTVMNAAKIVLPIVRQAMLLASEYHVVIANPPYMGGKGMNPKLKQFAKDSYPDSKSDLFAMFIERNLDLTLQQGAVAMITMQSWMFLSSFEKLRTKILDTHTILSMAHLGARGFDSIGGEVVSTTAFAIKKEHNPNYKGAYLRLVDGRSESEKSAMFKEAIQ